MAGTNAAKPETKEARAYSPSPLPSPPTLGTTVLDDAVVQPQMRPPLASACVCYELLVEHMTCVKCVGRVVSLHCLINRMHTYTLK